MRLLLIIAGMLSACCIKCTSNHYPNKHYDWPAQEWRRQNMNDNDGHPWTPPDYGEEATKEKKDEGIPGDVVNQFGDSRKQR